MTFEFKLPWRITSTLASGNRRQPMNYTSGLGGREMLGDGAIERIERHDPFQTTQDLEIGMSIIGRQSVDQGASKTHAFNDVLPPTTQQRTISVSISRQS